uniref:Putative salivary galectin n=1 Tax=Anopheles marajoara TaxID=58244 RepID=A0A2M4CA29_9DIPT
MNWFAALLLFRWSWLLIVLHPLPPVPLPVAALTPAAPPLPLLPTTGCPPLALPLAPPFPPPTPPPPLPAYAQDSSLLLQLLLDRRFCLE